MTGTPPARSERGSPASRLARRRRGAGDARAHAGARHGHHGVHRRRGARPPRFAAAGCGCGAGEVSDSRCRRAPTSRCSARRSLVATVDGAVTIVRRTIPARRAPRSRPPTRTRSWAADFIAAEELGRFTGMWWDPDSRRLLVQRTDERPLPVWTIPNPGDPAATPVTRPLSGRRRSERPPRAGDPRRRDRRVAARRAGTSSASPTSSAPCGRAPAGSLRRAEPRPAHARRPTAPTRPAAPRTRSCASPTRTGSSPAMARASTPRTAGCAGSWTRTASACCVSASSSCAARTARRSSIWRPPAPTACSPRSRCPASTAVSCSPAGTGSRPGSAPSTARPRRGPAARRSCWSSATLERSLPDASIVELRGRRSGERPRSPRRAEPLDWDEAIEFHDLADGGSSAALLLPLEHDAGRDGPLPVLPRSRRRPRLGEGAARPPGVRGLAPARRARVRGAGHRRRRRPGRSPAWERRIAGDLTVTLDSQVGGLEEMAARRPGVLDLGAVGIRGGRSAAISPRSPPSGGRTSSRRRGRGAGVGLDALRHALHGALPGRGRGLRRRGGAVVAAGSDRRDGRAGRPPSPMLVLHGYEDDNVVAAHAVRLSEALSAHGIPHASILLGSLTHVARSSVFAQLLRIELEFLDHRAGIRRRPARSGPGQLAARGPVGGRVLLQRRQRRAARPPAARAPRAARLLCSVSTVAAPLSTTSANGCASTAARATASALAPSSRGDPVAAPRRRRAASGGRWPAPP